MSGGAKLAFAQFDLHLSIRHAEVGQVPLHRRGELRSQLSPRLRQRIGCRLCRGLRSCFSGAHSIDTTTLSLHDGEQTLGLFTGLDRRSERAMAPHEVGE